MNHRLRNAVLHPDILLFLSDLTKLSSGFYSTIRTASTSSRGANYREQKSMRRLRDRAQQHTVLIKVEFSEKQKHQASAIVPLKPCAIYESCARRLELNSVLPWLDLGDPGVSSLKNVPGISHKRNIHKKNQLLDL